MQKFSLRDILQIVFEGPGKIIQTIIGGENIDFLKSFDVLTIGYVHPITQTIICVWAIGRASGAIAGEIDRGTMELLLAQPIRRSRVIVAHLCVDLLVIPLLCLSLWGGNWLGIATFGQIERGAQPPLLGLGAALARSPSLGGFRVDPEPRSFCVDPVVLLPALANVGLLLFAVSGVTMWLSSRGRFRGRVLGTAVFVMLLQFLINLIGQLWDKAEPLRPFTVFFYYQPQEILLQNHWTVDVGKCWHLSEPLAVNMLWVLGLVGAAGYVLAAWTFCRRDLPAPL
jgi:ABC-2 type transport system permease protein